MFYQLYTIKDRLHLKETHDKYGHTYKGIYYRKNTKEDNKIRIYYWPFFLLRRVLFFAIPVLLWMLDRSLASPESFADLKQLMTSPLAKLVLWAIFAGMMYHTVAGIKHLVADFGIGETMEGGVLGARIVFVVSAVLIVLGGLWIW